MSGLVASELTPRGAGAIAVLGLEGPGALARVAALCPGTALVPGRLRLARLELDGAPLDEALVVVLSEQQVELHLHGSPPLVRRLLEHLGGQARVARTLEERAAEQLARAPCEAAARLLLDQAEGALRAELEALLALSPAGQDARLDALLERARIASFALLPARVLLSGPVNAGKSTLCNALLGQERVLVSASEGTTRDAVLERAHLGAWPVDLIDAPGERPASGAGSARAAEEELERRGLDIARDLAAGAQLVLRLCPAPEPLPAAALGAADARTVVLTSRADLLDPVERRRRRPALAAGPDPRGAALLVGELFRARLGLPADPWLPGAAVPFEPAQVEALERVRSSRDRGQRRRRLARLLESGIDRPADDG